MENTYWFFLRKYNQVFIVYLWMKLMKYLLLGWEEVLIGLWTSVWTNLSRWFALQATPFNKGLLIMLSKSTILTTISFFFNKWQPLDHILLTKNFDIMKILSNQVSNTTCKIHQSFQLSKSIFVAQLNTKGKLLFSPFLQI